MTSDYRDRKVIVTGSSSGIGAALARALVQLGAEVHGASLAGPAVDGLASFTDLDLSSPESIETAAAALGGGADALFNCAGASPLGVPLHVLRVNFLGTRLFTDEVLNGMGSGGAVVSVGSNGGYGWRRHRDLVLDFLRHESFDDGLSWFESHRDSAGDAYSFSKQALTVWTMQRSADLAGRGVRINVVSPGAVETPMLKALEEVVSGREIDAVTQPIGRRSTPEEQVGPLLFLNSAAASYVSGVEVQVDGGFWAAQTLGGRFG